MKEERSVGRASPPARRSAQAGKLVPRPKTVLFGLLFLMRPWLVKENPWAPNEPIIRHSMIGSVTLFSACHWIIKLPPDPPLLSWTPSPPPASLPWD